MERALCVLELPARRRIVAGRQRVRSPARRLALDEIGEPPLGVGPPHEVILRPTRKVRRSPARASWYTCSRPTKLQPETSRTVHTARSANGTPVLRSCASAPSAGSHIGQPPERLGVPPSEVPGRLPESSLPPADGRVRHADDRAQIGKGQLGVEPQRPPRSRRREWRAALRGSFERLIERNFHGRAQPWHAGGSASAHPRPREPSHVRFPWLGHTWHKLAQTR